MNANLPEFDHTDANELLLHRDASASGCAVPPATDAQTAAVQRDTAGDPADEHAYHFHTVEPGTKAKLAYAQRPQLVPESGFATRCVHAGVQPDPAYGSVMPPVYLSSTYAFQDIATNWGYDYARSGNPTRATLEEALAALEGGSLAACTSTGMSAILLALNLLPANSEVLCTLDCYGGTFRQLEHLKQQANLRVNYLDLADLDALRNAVGPQTRAIWVETPSNPLLRLTDIAAVAEVAKANNLLLIVDNTFCSPYLQRPFELGADLVVHSTTKYLNGHSDVVGGAVIAAPGRHELGAQLQAMNNNLGLSQAPHDCYLVLRGLKTLKLRMQAHESNARTLAELLNDHPSVLKVNYPGLSSHPQHELAYRQQYGFGGMLSFRVRGGLAGVHHVLKRLRWFTLAESLGGVESLVAHPATMTHASMTPEARRNAGITDDLIRLSIGIEEMSDLAEDLRQALEEKKVASC